MNEMNQRLTKYKEREAMFDLLKEREGRTPQHTNPCWVHYFWRQRIMGNDEVRRMLSVGMATMSDHLRLYKDPFEPSSDDRVNRSIAMGTYVLWRPSCSEKNAALESESPICKQKISDPR